MTTTQIKEIIEQSIQPNTHSGKKNIVLDATVLTSLMNCPRFADLRFNHRLNSITGKSNSLECGSIVHTYLEFYYKAIINQVDKKQAHGFGMTAAELYIRGCSFCTDYTPLECSDCNGTKWVKQINSDVLVPCDTCKNTGLLIKPPCGHQINQFPGVKNTPIESGKDEYNRNKIGWTWVLKTCEEYNKFYVNDHWVPLEIEVVKSRILYEDKDIRILWKAKLDMTTDTNQGIYPVDHKTMSQNRQSGKLNNQFMGQCLVCGTRNVIINKVGFQTTLEPKERFLRPPVSYSEHALTEWYSETLPHYAYQLLFYSENGYFPPNYSNCDGKYGPCMFKSVCESDPDMREAELKKKFVVGPEWNPVNENEDE